MAVTVHQVAAGFADDTEVARALTDALGAAERLASEHGVERIRGAANHSLFAAGLDADGESADAALAFATALTHELVVDTDRDEIELVVRVGLSSGPVETGMLERGGLTFGVWGEPVRRALAISALAHDEVLVDAGTAASTSERWNLRPVDDVPALDGEPMTLFVVDDGARSS